MHPLVHTGGQTFGLSLRLLAGRTTAASLPPERRRTSKERFFLLSGQNTAMKTTPSISSLIHHASCQPSPPVSYYLLAPGCQLGPNLPHPHSHTNLSLSSSPVQSAQVSLFNSCFYHSRRRLFGFPAVPHSRPPPLHLSHPSLVASGFQLLVL